MKASDNLLSQVRPKTRGSILWLTGWSMPDTVLDELRRWLPDFQHVSAAYSSAECPESMLLLTEKAARSVMDSEMRDGPMLIAGWSLGGLLALRLAAQGLADGLVLFGATARFTRSGEESNRGWADAYVRRMISGVTKDRQTVETSFRKLVLTEDEWASGLGRRLPPAGGWSASALVAGLQLLRTESVLPMLPAIDCPVLLVHGTEDRICPYGAALELMAALPGAKLVSISACGHAPFLGKEIFIADELRRWWHDR
ncbi:alpha/beta hydrolase [Cohnella faecalis]|uniref:Alpha/beta fold hydrolase n=1 Tax=Cohnella faecalis TaxID=2315694 RepID=A0A398CQC8_9BACL|nr:alpha/beta fold hydrolase [Cohnella faecalis]RIE02988.1 alpha/beta fold hydrolase [Cohnella faecalis]